MQIHVNKYPYILWAYYRVQNPKLDRDNRRLKGENGTSTYKKVSGTEILLLKYLPLLLFVPFIYLPISHTGYVDILVSLGLFFLFLFAYKQKKEVWIEWGIYLTIAIVASFAGIFGVNAVDTHFFNVFHHIISWVIIYIVIKDYKNNDYRSYYKLTEKKHVEHTIIERGQRSFMKVPFSKKHLIKYTVKNPLTLGINVGGFYFIENKNQGNENVSN